MIQGNKPAAQAAFIKKSTYTLALYTLVLVLVLLTVGCSPEAAPSEEAVPVQPVGSQGEVSETSVANPVEDKEPEEAPAAAVEDISDPAAIQTAWENSAHAITFVQNEDGTNSACARCHAPANWVPTMDDMPESCYACKFEVDPPPPVIAEADWDHIECTICHEVKKGKVNPEIAWLEIAAIEQYAAVGSNSELCLKCHTAGEIDGHQTMNVDGAHAGMECTDCHNPHNLEAGCSTSGCHETLEAATEPVPGHDEAHAGVACEACHDASGLQIGPDESGSWLSYLTLTGEPVQYVSHNIVREAPCERCHFSANPWGLVEDAAAAP